jgi:mono/diheme cytochrome c family protein
MAVPHSTRRKLVLIWGILPIVFSCSGLGSVEEKNPSAENSDSVTASSLFLQHCAICHGEDGKLGASGAKDLTRSSLDSNQVVRIIKKGKNAMPQMKELLVTEDNIGLVTSYVLKFRR